jgi:hypothetical protein
MPAAAVQSDRSPLKKPWFTAPEIKLMPEYLSSMALCCIWKDEVMVPCEIVRDS